MSRYNYGPYYNYADIDFNWLNRNQSDIRNDINNSLYRNLGGYTYCIINSTRTGFYINIYEEGTRGSRQIGHVSIHPDTGHNRFHFINDIRRTSYPIEARIDVNSTVPIISRQASTTSANLANIVLGQLRHYMGGNDELLLLIEKIGMIELDKSNINLDVSITLKKEENKNNLSDEEILGVFRKLPQPSVSPAAPHPRKALLGSTESYEKLTIKNNKNNKNQPEVSYNKEKVIDIFKNNKLDEKLLTKKNIEDLYLISIILDSFIKVCNHTLLQPSVSPAVQHPSKLS
jgi:hypothetical protein